MTLKAPAADCAGGWEGVLVHSSAGSLLLSQLGTVLRKASCSWGSGTSGINERVPEIEAKSDSIAVEVEFAYCEISCPPRSEICGSYHGIRCL